MNVSAEWKFRRCLFTRKPMFADDTIELIPQDFRRNYPELGTVMTFDVIDLASGRISGEISLRMGESRALFYLGHIGYHIDPPYRGHHEALKACRLCLPLMRQYGKESFVITTDVDNKPSIRTCEELGCKLESVVRVPPEYRRRYGMGSLKKRFVFEFDCDEVSKSGGETR